MQSWVLHHLRVQSAQHIRTLRRQLRKRNPVHAPLLTVSTGCRVDGVQSYRDQASIGSSFSRTEMTL
jgi:hypothetical protein